MCVISVVVVYYICRCRRHHHVIRFLYQVRSIANDLEINGTRFDITTEYLVVSLTRLFCDAEKFLRSKVRL